MLSVASKSFRGGNVSLHCHPAIWQEMRVKKPLIILSNHADSSGSICDNVWIRIYSKCVRIALPISLMNMNGHPSLFFLYLTQCFDKRIYEVYFISISKPDYLPVLILKEPIGGSGFYIINIPAIPLSIEIPPEIHPNLYSCRPADPASYLHPTFF